jgi:hypothetical protein
MIRGRFRDAVSSTAWRCSERAETSNAKLRRYRGLASSHSAAVSYARPPSAMSRREPSICPLTAPATLPFSCTTSVRLSCVRTTAGQPLATCVTHSDSSGQPETCTERQRRSAASPLPSAAQVCPPNPGPAAGSATRVAADIGHVYELGQ